MMIRTKYQLSSGKIVPKHLQPDVFSTAMRMTSGALRGHWVPFNSALMDKAYEVVKADLAREASVPTNPPWVMADGSIVPVSEWDGITRLAVADGLPMDYNRRPWMLDGVAERVRHKSRRLAKSQDRLQKWCERVGRLGELDIVHSILIYDDAGAVWVDIPDLGVWREQMVCGADTLYHELTQGVNRPFGWELRFSAQAFSGAQVVLDWRSQNEIGWDKYWCNPFDHWVDLCPVLRLVYPTVAPQKIFVSIKKI